MPRAVVKPPERDRDTCICNFALHRRSLTRSTFPTRKMMSTDDGRHILNGIHKYSDMASSLPRPKYNRRRSHSATRANVRFPDEKITLNVGGVRFQTFRATLRKHPQSLLFDIPESSKYFDEQKQEFFFDRSASMFDGILSYYRTGELHFGTQHCAGKIKNELEFWKIPISTLSECCWLRYVTEHDERKKREDLKFIIEEAQLLQKATIDNLREMPPNDEAKMTNKVFDFLQVSTIYPDIKLMTAALNDCRSLISLFFLLIFAATLFFASLIWIFESSDTIPGVLSAIWWALVTMTTVGSGGVQPQSTIGCFIGMVCIVCGIVVIALPLPLVGALLNDMRKRLKENQILEDRIVAAASQPGVVMRESVGERGRHVERKKVI